MNIPALIRALEKDSRKGLLLVAEVLGTVFLKSDDSFHEIAKTITGHVPTDERSKGIRDALLEMLAASEATRLTKEIGQDSLECPRCHETGGMNVYYTSPLKYECKVCGAISRDANDPGIPVLTQEQAKQKRPRMYGLPACPECDHAVHGEERCPVCDEQDAPRNIRLVEVQ